MVHTPEVPPIKHVIWDSALTLTTIHSWGIVKEVGLIRFFRLLVRGYTPLAIRRRIYTILIDQEGPQVIDVSRGEEYVRDEKGIILPAFVVDKWLASQMTDAQILTHISCAVDAWAAKNPTMSRFEHESIKKIMHVMFAAESIARNTRPIKQAAQLVHKIAHQASKALEGKRAIAQYILSNWQKESFEKIFNKPQNRGLFGLFAQEQVISSGSCGLVKPHRSIFEYLLTKNKLTAAECLFIDDQEENVVQARAVGMHALLLERGNYKKLERELRALRIL